MMVSMVLIHSGGMTLLEKGIELCSGVIIASTSGIKATFCCIKLVQETAIGCKIDRPKRR